MEEEDFPEVRSLVSSLACLLVCFFSDCCASTAVSRVFSMAVSHASDSEDADGDEKSWKKSDTRTTLTTVAQVVDELGTALQGLRLVSIVAIRNLMTEGICSALEQVSRLSGLCLVLSEREITGGGTTRSTLSTLTRAIITLVPVSTNRYEAAENDILTLNARQRKL